MSSGSTGARALSTTPELFRVACLISPPNVGRTSSHPVGNSPLIIRPSSAASVG